MKTITDKTEIENLFNEASKHQGAFATCRVLQEIDCQEWAEHCEINETPAKIYWIFEDWECDVEDGADMPWFDMDNVTKIELAEKDEDGDWDNL